MSQPPTTSCKIILAGTIAKGLLNEVTTNLAQLTAANQAQPDAANQVQPDTANQANPVQPGTAGTANQDQPGTRKPHLLGILANDDPAAVTYAEWTGRSCVDKYVFSLTLTE